MYNLKILTQILAKLSNTLNNASKKCKLKVVSFVVMYTDIDNHTQSKIILVAGAIRPATIHQ